MPGRQRGSHAGSVLPAARKCVPACALCNRRGAGRNPISLSLWRRPRTLAATVCRTKPMHSPSRSMGRANYAMAATGPRIGGDRIAPRDARHEPRTDQCPRCWGHPPLTHSRGVTAQGRLRTKGPPLTPRRWKCGVWLGWDERSIAKVRIPVRRVSGSDARSADAPRRGERRSRESIPLSPPIRNATAFRAS